MRRKIFWGICACCALLPFSGLLYEAEHYAWEGWFGFYGIFGFVSCLLAVMAARLLRLILMRDEDYYDR